MRYQFVDCRWELGNPERGKALFLQGHIPGAAFLDVDEILADPPGPAGRHPLPDLDAFQAAAWASGIGDDVFVIAYGNMGGPERLWWLLRHIGHDNCAVIDFDSWCGPLEVGDKLQHETHDLSFRLRTDDTIEADELASRLDELVVVDTRIPSRYRGEPNPLDKVPGCIPGAINAPWNEPLPELPEGELVAYCGSGVTACIALHRLALSGRDAKLYPGSWSEWEQRDDLPVERG